jgi:pyruvate formate lyase activating enzyme
VESISEEEFFKYISKRSGMLDGVCITGGEPLLCHDIEEFITRIRSYGLLIKLDTNGSFPQKLEALLNKGLIDYVAMDIKNSPEKYTLATGDVNIDMKAIEESKELLLSGVVNYEFRTTVVKGIHTEESILSLAKWIASADKYYLQQFKNSGELLSPEGLSEFSSEEMKKFKELASRFVPSAEIRGL